MIRFKLALKSMLSLPVVREAQAHYMIVIGALAYFGLLFLVLKTFQINKGRSED